ncbi:MAG: cupredoxin domain-containing protein [Candidatus Nanosalina sp.]
MKKYVIIGLMLVLTVSVSQAIVMNNNPEELPPGCRKVTGERNLKVHAGTEYAKKFNSKVYTYDQRVYSFEPCTRVTVTLVNNDSIRHQWMIHGLPMETYPMGMFTIEVDGPGQDTGIFIVPNVTETLLLHCGIPQHMQKGMKGMIKINGGDGQISNVPGFTGVRKPYSYEYREKNISLKSSALILASSIVIGLLVSSVFFFRREVEQKEES